MVNIPVHRSHAEHEADHEPLEHRSPPNSAAIVVCHWGSVKAVSVGGTLVVGPPRAPFPQPFRVGTGLRRRLSERRQELIAHVGCDQVAYGSGPRAWFRPDESLDLFRTCTGRLESLQEAPHPVSAM